MILPILVAVMMLVEAPAATPAPAVSLPPAARPAPVAPADDRPTIDAITAIDRLMEPYRGKAGDSLRGKLGLTYSTTIAKDGEVVFWRTRADSMGCGVANGVMRCGSVANWECQLAVAFDKTGKVTTWKASGAPEACVKMAILLQPDK